MEAVIKTKVCASCNKELPATKEYFYTQKEGKYGLHSRCKNCRKIDGKKYRDENQDKLKAHRENTKEQFRIYQKSWYIENSDKVKEYGKSYYQANKDKITARHKVWHDINKDYLRDKNKALYIENKEQILARNKRYREKNREKAVKRSRLYYSRNKEQTGKRCKTYRDANKEQYKGYYHCYVAKKRKAVIAKFSLKIWLASQPHPLRCYLCGKRIKKADGYHIDHRIPLSRGGAHAPHNLGITCPTCNLQKHAKTPSEYAPDRFRPELAL